LKLNRKTRVTATLRAITGKNKNLFISNTHIEIEY
jgi:hypothetical protein